MKTITKQLTVLSLLLLLFGANQSNAQCTASFIYSNNANGNVTFTSTSITSSISTTYYWTFGNSIPTFTGTGSAGIFPNYTYTANGTYVVTLFILSTAPSCSTMTQQTITITNANTSTCTINANFNYSQGSNGLVNFNNTSTGTVSGVTYSWNFGDNTTPSTLTSPAHTYSANGVYVATLTANNNLSVTCVDTQTLNVFVNSYCTLAAGFNYSISGGTVNFYNTTTPSVAVSYTWNFGNSLTSNLPNPNTTYTTNGVYTVTLIAASNSPLCSSSSVQTITITSAPACAINANFSYSQGSNGLINFNNTSTGTITGVTYSWNFGDNTSPSTSASPAHTYSANGVYVATLTANNNMTPTCVDSQTMNVFVSSYCNLVAGFNYTPGANGSVSFGNTTTGTASNTIYNWNFGDSGTSSNANPTHNYANGTYTVVLTATNFSTFPTCMDTVMQVITVTSNTCVANANFTLTPTNTPKLWNAIPTTTSNISNVIWNWGDGNTSNTLFTSHLYSVSATYTICLSLTVTCGASSTYCSSYFIFKSTSGESNEMLQVNVVAPGTTGIKDNSSETIDFSIFPNPSNGEFLLKMNGIATEKVKVSVYNLMGQKVLESVCETNNGKLDKRLDLAKEMNGVYFVEVSAADRTYTRKLVLSH